MRDERALRQRIGKNIQRLRDARDLTQEKLAERTRRSVVYIRRIEAGRGNPTSGVLMSIAEALSADFSELTIPLPPDATRRSTVQTSDDSFDKMGRQIQGLTRQVAELTRAFNRAKRQRR